MHVTDIHESDDTPQAAASTGERTCPQVLPEAKIDDDDDDDDNDDLHDELGDQGNKDRPIDNNFGDLCYQINDEDLLDVATHNRLMLQMLLENQAQWKAKQTFARERMAAERNRTAANWDQWATECAELTERTTVCS